MDTPNNPGHCPPTPAPLRSVKTLAKLSRLERFEFCAQHQEVHVSVLQGIVGLTALMKLGLQKVELLESDSLAALAALPHLKDLEILGRAHLMSSEGLCQLAKQSAASVTELSLSYCQVGKEAMEAIGRSWPRLTDLELFECIHDDLSYTTMSGISSFTTLEHLHLDQQWYGKTEQERFYWIDFETALLPSLQSLVTLHIRMGRWQGIPFKPQVVKDRFPSLNYLEVNFATGEETVRLSIDQQRLF